MLAFVIGFSLPRNHLLIDADCFGISSLHLCLPKLQALTLRILFISDAVRLKLCNFKIRCSHHLPQRSAWRNFTDANFLGKDLKIFRTVFQEMRIRMLYGKARQAVKLM
jgi:hypothetical protein